MSATLIVSVIAIIVAGAALVNQFRPRTDSTSPTPPPAPMPPTPSQPTVSQPTSQQSSSHQASATLSEPEAPAAVGLPQILVDTSAIIDGRIADIAAAGFVPGRLAVPRFVLAELQNIADSDDAMRRGRGRRGLDVLSTLREMPDIEVEIIEDDAPKIREVDAKLVALAQRFNCNVLTTDYNLNRVAQIQGVRVLNVNELSNAIRPVVLPGEELVVRVVQPGKERHQGVGYLADGTMIVVENGDKLMGQEVATEVTRVFQTVAGKMIFATPRTTAGQPVVLSSALAPAQPTSPLPAATQAEPHAVDNQPPATRGTNAQTSVTRTGSHQDRGSRHSQSDIEGRLIAATNATTNSTPQPHESTASAANRSGGNANHHVRHRQR